MANSRVQVVLEAVLQHCDTFKEGNSAAELIERFSAISDPSRQVVFLKNILANFKPPFSNFPNSKNADEVEAKYLNEAKCYMEIGSFDYALSCLNKGLSLVPQDRPDLLLKVFSLRAEILLRSRQFEACARDVNRALPLTKDDTDLRDRLNKIMVIVTKYSAHKTDDPEAPETEAGDSENVAEITKSLKLEDKKKDWAVECPNPMVPCASDALTLVDQGSGLTFVATREIKPGEILMVLDPLVASVDSRNFDICSFCMKKGCDLLACDTCSWDMYCSEKCKAEAEKYHAKECPMLPKVLPKRCGAEDVLQSLLKMVLKYGRREFCKAAKDEHLGVSKPLLCSDLNTLFLPAISDSHDSGQFFLWSAFMVVWTKELGYDREMPEQEFNKLVAKLARALPYVSNCSFSVDQVVKNGGYIGEDTFEAIGKAVYPVKMLVQRSCSPNTIGFNVGCQNVVQSTRLIRAGCPITQVLHPELDFLKVNRDLRHSFLKDVPFLMSRKDGCDCEACANNWSTLDKLEGCPDDLEVHVLTQTKLTQELLPFALSKVEDMERRNLQHTKEFHILQEKIRMRLAKQGLVATPKFTNLRRVHQILLGED